MTIETERLLLREYTMEDFDALHEILSDPETMQHYPTPFSREKTRDWIFWNLDNYPKYGFGLWAVVLKENGEFIGDCGISLQSIDGELLRRFDYVARCDDRSMNWLLLVRRCIAAFEQEHGPISLPEENGTSE